MEDAFAATLAALRALPADGSGADSQPLAAALRQLTSAVDNTAPNAHRRFPPGALSQLADVIESRPPSSFSALAAAHVIAYMCVETAAGSPQLLAHLRLMR